jgi:hypothetical protein
LRAPRVSHERGSSNGYSHRANPGKKKPSYQPGRGGWGTRDNQTGKFKPLVPQPPPPTPQNPEPWKDHPDYQEGEEAEEKAEVPEEPNQCSSAADDPSLGWAPWAGAGLVIGGAVLTATGVLSEAGVPAVALGVGLMITPPDAPVSHSGSIPGSNSL